MDYTLGQFQAFSAAAEKLENERYAALLNVIAIGSQGYSKAVEKMLKTLCGG